jgi:dUTP pyrophosphatase
MKRPIDYINEAYGLCPEKGADKMNEVNVNVKRLSPDAILPRKAHESDAGFDLYAVEDTVIEPGETALIKTGLAVELPEGFEMQIRPRSGVTLKTKLRVQLGTVDCSYRGEVGVIVDNIEVIDECNKRAFVPRGADGCLIENYVTPTLLNTYIIRKGERVAQAVIAKLPAVEICEVGELGETLRGEGGFGSSGVSE